MSSITKGSKYIVIIGCGRLGSSIANYLSDKGENVLIIDKNEDSFRKLSISFAGITIVGNGKDIDVLNQANIDENSIAIVVTDNDNTNIMISEMISKVFKTTNVILRLYDSDKKISYDNLSINTICPHILSSMEILKLILGDIA